MTSQKNVNASLKIKAVTEASVIVTLSELLVKLAAGENPRNKTGNAIKAIAAKLAEPVRGKKIPKRMVENVFLIISEKEVKVTMDLRVDPNDPTITKVAVAVTVQ